MDLLTEAEAALIAKVHPRTIRRRIDDGTLKACNYGTGGKKLYRINPADLGDVQPNAVPAPPERRPRRQRRQRELVTSGPAWPPPVGWVPH